MSETYISLLAQVPLVGIFIWFTLKLIAIFQTAQDARDKAYIESLSSIVKSLQDHDTHVDVLFRQAINAVEHNAQMRTRRDDA